MFEFAHVCLDSCVVRVSGVRSCSMTSHVLHWSFCLYLYVYSDILCIWYISLDIGIHIYTNIISIMLQAIGSWAKQVEASLGKWSDTLGSWCVCVCVFVCLFVWAWLWVCLLVCVFVSVSGACVLLENGLVSLFISVKFMF